jgi:hypothetical protein
LEDTTNIIVQKPPETLPGQYDHIQDRGAGRVSTFKALDAPASKGSSWHKSVLNTNLRLLRDLKDDSFTCSGVSMAFTQDGSRLAIASYYLRDPKDTSYSSRVILLDPQSPYLACFPAPFVLRTLPPNQNPIWWKPGFESFLQNWLCSLRAIIGIKSLPILGRLEG